VIPIIAPFILDAGIAKSSDLKPGMRAALPSGSGYRSYSGKSSIKHQMS